jgi:hypothetical protein
MGRRAHGYKEERKRRVTPRPGQGKSQNKQGHKQHPGLLNNKGKKEKGSLGYPDISLFFGKMECEYVSPSTSKVWE